MKILIGSSAIKHWFPDFKREPKDIDYIVDVKPKYIQLGIRVEYLFNPVFDGYKHPVMLPDDLLTLKASHLFWDIQWEKHMFDVQYLIGKGHKINRELFYRLYAYWQTVHGKNKRSNLELTKEEFFDNAVKCEHEHDFLHTLLNPIPTYTKILEDGKEVEVSEEKYNLLSHSEKLELVREEIYVMAYERLNNRDYRSAYAWMLKKFIMSHAPMWEALFIIENYVALHKPIYNYKLKLENGLQAIKRTA